METFIKLSKCTLKKLVLNNSFIGKTINIRTNIFSRKQQLCRALNSTSNSKMNDDYWGQQTCDFN